MTTSVFGQTITPDLITADALLENYADYKIIDISKHESFETAHIEGALHIWRPDYEDHSYDYGGMMASKAQMADLLSKLGITATDNLVLYDHKGGCDAARVKWILDYYGHANTHLLDGGLKTWGNRNDRLDGFADSIALTDYQFNGEEDHSNHIKLDLVKAALDDPNTIIIDTRSKEEYEGNFQKDGAFQAGRIPNSIHIDWAACIDYDGNQNIYSTEALKAIFEPNGVTKDKAIICYCHSGVRSAHMTFVLSEILGYPNVKNYDGSWIEWSFNDNLPIETGTDTQLAMVQEASFSDIFWQSFKDFGNYTWNEITFRVSPGYINYFWFLILLSIGVWILEILFPWRKNQPIFRKDFWMDAFFMFFNFYIFKLVIFMAFSNVTAKFFHDIIGGDVTSYALFDMSGLPVWIQLVIFFVATDFIQWFTHVMLHRFNFFWRFHKVHHSVEQMGFAAHLRYHWMENVIYTPMKYIMVMLIGGFTPDMAFIVFYVAIAIGHLNHANINMDYGPLKYIFNNPKMHIWHHAKDLPESRRYGVNFGISLSLWDYIFGKNYIPSDGRDIPLGFPNIDRYPKKFFPLIWSGFRKTPDED